MKCPRVPTLANIPVVQKHKWIYISLVKGEWEYNAITLHRQLRLLPGTKLGTQRDSGQLNCPAMRGRTGTRPSTRTHINPIVHNYCYCNNYVWNICDWTLVRCNLDVSRTFSNICFVVNDKWKFITNKDLCIIRFVIVVKAIIL